MSTSRGIPPVSDYAHWNEEAEAVWYAENKYDMMHPEVFEQDDQDYFVYYDEEDEDGDA